jgi:hypothetical protein
MQSAYIAGPTCDAVRLAARVDANKQVRLSVLGGMGCAFRLQTSTDLHNWTDSIQIQPDQDPFDVQFGPASAAAQFFRLRNIAGSSCQAVRLGVRIDANRQVQLSVRSGRDCAFQVQSSADLHTWTDAIQIQPDQDPFEVQIGSARADAQFFRLRKLD